MGQNSLVLYNADRPAQARRLALLGLTDQEIAGVMDINVNTIDLWKRKYPDFLEELNKGKLEADARVAEALYKRAVGYDIPEVHVAVNKGEVIKTVVMRHIPPDPWSAARWLSIRQRGKWTEVQKTEIMQTTININKLDFSGIGTEELALMERVMNKQLTQNAGGN